MKKNEATVAAIEKAVMDWFRLAKDRDGGRDERNKTKTNLNT